MKDLKTEANEAGAVAGALAKYRSLEAEADRARDEVRAHADSMQDARDRHRALARDLAHARSKTTRDPKAERRLESEIASADRAYRDAERARDAARASADRLGALADACRQFLESGGATVAELEQGAALPRAAPSTAVGAGQ